MKTPAHYISNPELANIRPGWPGTPLAENGRFVNEEFPFTPRFLDVLKWITGPKPHKHEKRSDAWRPRLRHDAAFLSGSEDCVVWLGHASFFIRLGGKRLLTDPVFYKVPFVKRLSPAPFPPAVFTGLDYLLISHDHRDHCQEKSVRALVAASPGLTVLTGLRMEKLLRPWLGGTSVQEAGWYQQYDTGAALRVSYLPARHWGRRGLTDTNRRLWGGFVLQSPERSIYFGGDSGYGSHYREAGRLFPGLDLALLGVGAFRPEWFMGPSHMSPADAVKAFGGLGAGAMMPMHYGTFDLSDEAISEPPRLLRTLERERKIPGKLLVPELGEAVFL